MDEKLLKKIEFDKVLDIISAFTVSEIARTEIFDLISPKTDIAAAEVLLAETEEAFAIYYSECLKPLTPFDDALRALLKSKVSALLTLSEIRRVMFLLRAGRVARSVISASQNGKLLKNYTARYVGDNALEKEIEVSVVSDTEVGDNASALLRDVRKKLAAARARLGDTVKKYSRSSEVSKYLQDDLVTLRDGRYVLPVKTEYRGFVPGLVHDRSQTGATLFIEPFNIIESNNEIRSLQIEEQQEIERIIKALTEKIAADFDDLCNMQSALKSLDAIFAKAHFAAEFNCVRPVLNDCGRIVLVGSRHPLIDRQRVVPVSISLGAEAAAKNFEAGFGGTEKTGTEIVGAEIIGASDSEGGRCRSDGGKNEKDADNIGNNIGSKSNSESENSSNSKSENNSNSKSENNSNNISDNQNVNDKGGKIKGGKTGRKAPDCCRILTVTGPNTGGKTVVLKTMGLFCVMASAGIFIPALCGSQTAVFDDVFADIGDNQSIASSLSTFSSHIKNIADILDNVTKNSLVLLDELGSGTDPEEGAALALGIIKYLELVGACVVVTTHYDRLKQYAMGRSNIQNASMQFDNQSLRPTYRVIEGLPGSSNALKIAGTLGINDYVIKEAIKSMPEDRVAMEKLIGQAEELKNRSILELEQLRREKTEVERLKAELGVDLAKLKEQRQKIQENARAEIRRIVSNSADTAAELIEQIKAQIKISDERALLEARRLMRKIEDVKFEDGGEEQDSGAYKTQIMPLKESLLKEGMDVYIISLGVTGRVLKLNRAKREASVQAGAAAAKIKFDNLASLDSAALSNPEGGLNRFKNRGDDKQVVRQKRSDSAGADSVFVREINVMGHIVSEAVELIDVTLLAMAEGGEQHLRIVHGKGTGALGRGIQAYLKTVKEVRSYRYGGYGEGETGVTIVELKD